MTRQPTTPTSAAVAMALALPLALALALSGCTGASGPRESPAASQQTSATSDGPATTLVDVAEPPRVLPATTAAEAALAMSRALFETAPLAVLAAADDLNAQATAASAAAVLGAPVLLTVSAAAASPSPIPDAELLRAELERLTTTTLLTVGPGASTTADGLDVEDVVPAPSDPAALGDLLGTEWSAVAPTLAPALTQAVAGLDPAAPVLLTLDPPPSAASDSAPTDHAPTERAQDAELPDVRRATPRTPTTVMTTGAVTDLAAVAGARGAGAQVLVVPSGDPRVSAETVAALGKAQPQRVLALGQAFGDDARLATRTASASTGVQLPAGGQVVFPYRRFVALYGHPGAPVLGVLGEQPLEQAIQRAKDVAAQYQPLSEVPIVPTLEIITTVASGSAGPDGDYSNESDPEELRPWVEAAGAAGMYVLLDLQPGTTDFLTQAQRYESLLGYPHVGLALDPEWRLAPGERHLEQIGSVTADEINSVSAWLAELTRNRSLPQKMLVLHQFTPSMIVDRERLDTSHDELAITIHADGNGSRGAKIASWDRLRTDPPPGVWWAWKNFYDEDSPTFSPEETYALEPRPVLVSYQ